MKKVVKLTPQMMKKLVKEEAEKLVREKADLDKNLEDSMILKLGKSDEADEVEADEYADTLEKHIDFYKANKVKESRILANLKVIREQNAVLLKKITTKL